MSDVTIEVRCKGGFAYVRGKAARRWLAVPPPLSHHYPEDAHLCHLHVRTDLLVNPNHPKFQTTMSFAGFSRFKDAVTGLVVAGAQHEDPKDGHSSSIPGDGKPNGDPALDTSWTSQGFIPSLRRLHPSLQEPVADVNLATFLMSLPAKTEWHGLAPWETEMQTCMWEFVRAQTLESILNEEQAITDVVGFLLRVPAVTKLSVSVGDTTHEVDVNFAGSYSYPLVLTAGPKSAKKPVQGQPLEHFKHLYHLSDPNHPLAAVPICKCRTSLEKADNIFCPGGEGEGEEGGGG